MKRLTLKETREYVDDWYKSSRSYYSDTKIREYFRQEIIGRANIPESQGGYPINMLADWAMQVFDNFANHIINDCKKYKEELRNENKNINRS